MDPIHQGPLVSALETMIDEIDGIIIMNPFGYKVAGLLFYEQWCIKNSKLLIMDNAACPLGFLEDGRCIHDIGDGAIVSLHETKPLGRGEGGVAFTKPDLSPYFERAINFGYENGRNPDRDCSNGKMSAFAAAAICDHLDRVIERNLPDLHREFAVGVIKSLQDMGFTFPFQLSFPTLLACLYVILPDDIGKSTQFIELLKASSIEAKQYYLPLTSEEEAPKCWDIYSRSISIPLSLDSAKNEYMLSTVKTILAQLRSAKRN
jgi:dTDP-4-amino-4,6-dideoxygalactose transaminase